MLYLFCLRGTVLEQKWSKTVPFAKGILFWIKSMIKKHPFEKGYNFVDPGVLFFMFMKQYSWIGGRPVIVSQMV